MVNKSNINLEDKMLEQLMIIGVLNASDQNLTIAEIASRTGLHPYTVTTHIHQMEDNGQIKSVWNNVSWTFRMLPSRTEND